MNRKTRILSISIALAAIFFIIINLQGKQNSKEKNPPMPSEKEITQSIEGQNEKVDMTLHHGSFAEYTIYIDESRYKMVNEDKKDIITTIEPLPENYPPVSLEITQIPNQQPDEVLQNLQKELQQNFPNLQPAEKVTEPVNGYLLHGADGNESTSKIVHAYVISNEIEGSFILQGNYFLEAAEGHGARFYHMLESFEIHNDE